MKTKKHALLFAALLLGGMSASYALEMTGLKPGVPASTATAQAMAKRHATLYGDPAGQSQASRIIDVKPGMRYVNVDSGETVAFRAGEKIVAWTLVRPRFCRQLQRSSWVSFLESHGRQAAIVPVAALSVVEHLDVVEHV